MAAADVAYLCDAANRYFRERVDPSDVIRTVSGANTVMDPASSAPRGDGAMTFDATARQGAAADDLRRRRHDLAAARGAGGLAADAVLSDVAALDREGAAAGRRFRLGAVRRARSIARASAGGFSARTRRGVWSPPTARGLRPCSATPGSRADLGPAFGPELTGAEVRYLMAKEWARFPDDILWRRSKLGLTMPPADREALAAFMATAS